jgi:uncharacterized caspase-like protein
MPATGLRLLIALFAALAITTQALAERRVALVIGNSAYKHAPALANSKNDAEGMSASLRRLKFDVVLSADLDGTGMRRQLPELSIQIEKADVALVIYVGPNYIASVNSKLERATGTRL